MKKITRVLSIVMCLAMIFSFASCGSGDGKGKNGEEATVKKETQEIALDKKVTSDDYAELTLVKAYSDGDIKATFSDYQDLYVYDDFIDFVLATFSDYQDLYVYDDFIDFVFDITVLVDGKTSDDLFEAYISNGEDKTEPAYIEVETDVMSELEESVKFNSGSMYRTHIVFEFDDAPEDGKLTLKVNEDKFKYAFSTGDNLTGDLYLDADEIIGSKATQFAVGTKVTVTDYAEVTLYKIETTSKASATCSDSGYEADDGEYYVDCVFDVKTMASEAIDCSEFMKLRAFGSSSATYDDCTYFVETEAYTYVSAYEDLSPVTEYRYHASVKVPDTETDIKLMFDVNGAVYKYAYKLNDVVADRKEIKSGDTISETDFADVKLVSVKFADEVKPRDTSGYYSYYKADDSKTYLVLTFEITNNSGSSKDIDEFVCCKALFDGKYNYNGFACSNNDSGTYLGTYNDIDAKCKDTVYYLIEIPDSIKDTSYTVNIGMYKNEYAYNGSAKTN